MNYNPYNQLCWIPDLSDSGGYIHAVCLCVCDFRPTNMYKEIQAIQTRSGECGKWRIWGKTIGKKMEGRFASLFFMMLFQNIRFYGIGWSLTSIQWSVFSFNLWRLYNLYIHKFLYGFISQQGHPLSDPDRFSAWFMTEHQKPPFLPLSLTTLISSFHALSAASQSFITHHPSLSSESPCKVPIFSSFHLLLSYPFNKVWK